MRYFEDLVLGEKLSIGGLRVDAGEAAEFARRYDPEHIPRPEVAYPGGGPEISPWLVPALSWKLLAELTTTASVEEAEFSQPSELQWKDSVRPSDTLRVEAEVIELLPPSPRLRKHGWARVKVSLHVTSPAGLGRWGDDEDELVESVALTYLAYFRARRREEVSIYYGHS